MKRIQRSLSLVLVLVVLAVVSGFAASTATDLLLAKARSLEGRATTLRAPTATVTSGARRQR